MRSKIPPAILFFLQIQGRSGSMIVLSFLVWWKLGDERDSGRLLSFDGSRHGENDRESMLMGARAI